MGLHLHHTRNTTLCLSRSRSLAHRGSEQTPAGPANYAIDCDASTMTLTRKVMPQTFDWPLDAPIVAHTSQWPHHAMLPISRMSKAPTVAPAPQLVPGSVKRGRRLRNEVVSQFS